MRKALVVVELLLVALLAASLYLFVFVPSSAPRRADAIVVLSSAKPRYDLGRRLYRERTAPTLVLSLPAYEGAGRACPRPALCFRARPYSTRGEAEAVGRLARAHRWRSLVVVTSRYHVRRAQMLFGRCLGGVELHFVAAGADLYAYARNVPLEWAKLAYQVARQRRC